MPTNMRLKIWKLPWKWIILEKIKTSKIKDDKMVGKLGESKFHSAIHEAAASQFQFMV